MISARDFGLSDSGIAGVGGGDGINDGLWCQSANNGSDIGSWKLPNGIAVPDVPIPFKVDPQNPIHKVNRPGQVGLLRSHGIGRSPYEGMYTCTIPDQNGVNQILVVWAAGNGAYDGTSANHCELK